MTDEEKKKYEENRKQKYSDLKDEHIKEINSTYEKELREKYKRTDIPTDHPLWNTIISRVLRREWKNYREELTIKGAHICELFGYGEDNCITREKEKIRQKVSCSILENNPMISMNCFLYLRCEYYKKTMKDLLEKEKLLKEASSYFEKEIKNCDLYR